MPRPSRPSPRALARALCAALACAALACAGARTPAPGAVPVSPAPAPGPIAYVGGYSGTIARFAWNAAAGTLVALGTTEAGRKPSFLAIAADGAHLYAVDQLPDRQGRVAAFSVDRSAGRSTGALTRLGDASSAGLGPAHVSLDRTGRWVLVANYAGGAPGTVAVLPVLAGGGVGAPVSTIEFGQDARPHFITTDPSNDFVLVPCLGLDAVAQLRFDARTGKLGRNQPDRVASAPGAGPRHLAFHPGGRFAYVINESNSTMTAYGYDGAAGRLAPLQTLSTLPPDWTGKNSGAHVEVHPSGRWLYGSNRGHDSVAVFAIEQETGRLTPAGHATETIKTPRNFRIAPDGAFLLVASQAAHVVSVFRIGADGALALVGSPTPVPEGPSFVGFLGFPGAPGFAEPRQAALKNLD